MNQKTITSNRQFSKINSKSDHPYQQSQSAVTLATANPSEQELIYFSSELKKDHRKELLASKARERFENWAFHKVKPKQAPVSSQLQNEIGGYYDHCNIKGYMPRGVIHSTSPRKQTQSRPLTANQLSNPNQNQPQDNQSVKRPQSAQVNMANSKGYLTGDRLHRPASSLQKRLQDTVLPVHQKPFDMGSNIWHHNFKSGDIKQYDEYQIPQKTVQKTSHSTTRIQSANPVTRTTAISEKLQEDYTFREQKFTFRDEKSQKPTHSKSVCSKIELRKEFKHNFGVHNVPQKETQNYQAKNDPYITKIQKVTRVRQKGLDLNAKPTFKQESEMEKMRRLAKHMKPVTLSSMRQEISHGKFELMNNPQTVNSSQIKKIEQTTKKDTDGLITNVNGSMISAIGSIHGSNKQQHQSQPNIEVGDFETSMQDELIRDVVDDDNDVQSSVDKFNNRDSILDRLIEEPEFNSEHRTKSELKVSDDNVIGNRLHQKKKSDCFGQEYQNAINRTEKQYLKSVETLIPFSKTYYEQKQTQNEKEGYSSKKKIPTKRDIEKKLLGNYRTVKTIKVVEGSTNAEAQRRLKVKQARFLGYGVQEALAHVDDKICISKTILGYFDQ